jgi:flavin-dependent dehydrogenase
MKYDVIVVGAGPSGLVAAKAIGENGFNVALLERKSNLTLIDRACGQTLDSPLDYLNLDLYRCNIRDKRLCFPSHGFSVKYDGSYRNAYACHVYSPNGHMIQAGVTEEQKKKGDYGKVIVTCDKEVLLRCLLEEAKAYSVEVFPGINIQKVTPTADGVTAEGSGQSFEGRYLIAADGVNSRIAEMMGFNNDRTYYCTLRGIAYYVSNLEVPDVNATHYILSFIKDGPVQLFIWPRPNEGEYIVCPVTVHPKVELEAAWDYFAKEAFCASWFRNVKILRTFSAKANCYFPVIEPYKDRVLLTGDTCATCDIDITGAMIWGWQAGHAISLSLQEENLGLEVTATSDFIKRWQENHVECHSHDAYMRNWALPYILTEPDEIDYVFSLIKEPLPPSSNPYDQRVGKAVKNAMPTIQQERPDIFLKLERAGSTSIEIFANVTKISKPV